MWSLLRGMGGRSQFFAEVYTFLYSLTSFYWIHGDFQNGVIQWVPDNSVRDKSARKWGQIGPYVKTTRTINKIDGNHKDTVWHLSTVLGNVKKKSLYNQPKPYFFQKNIVKSFLDRFLQILHQNIRNCLYIDWVFTHYVVTSYLDL